MKKTLYSEKNISEGRLFFDSVLKIIEPLIDDWIKKGYSRDELVCAAIHQIKALRSNDGSEG